MKRAFESLRRNAGILALLLVVTGGTAYAVDGPNPGQNTIGSEDIIGNEVKSDDIGNGRVFNVDLADETIQGDKVRNGTLTGLDVGRSYQITDTFGTFANGTCAGVDAAGNIGGGGPGDYTIVSSDPAPPAGVLLSADVVSENSLRIRACNLTGGQVNLPSAKYRVLMIRP